MPGLKIRIYCIMRCITDEVNILKIIDYVLAYCENASITFFNCSYNQCIISPIKMMECSSKHIFRVFDTSVKLFASYLRMQSFVQESLAEVIYM